MEFSAENEYIDCCSRFSSSSNESLSRQLQSQSTPCSSVSSSETVSYHPELPDDEFIYYTTDELEAKVEAKQRDEEAQRSLASFLLDAFRTAHNLEELSSVEEFANSVYARINLMGGDSSVLEGMISPLKDLEAFDCCSRFSSSSNESMSSQLQSQSTPCSSVSSSETVSYHSTPCSSVSSSETVSYHPELPDDEFIDYTTYELDAKVEAKQRDEEAQRSLASFLLDALRTAHNLEELSSVEEFANSVYARINLMGGDSWLLEGMISPLFELCHIAQNKYSYVWQCMKEVKHLEALTETVSKLIKQIHGQIEESEAKIKRWEEKICVGELALMNIWVQINRAMSDLIVGNDVYKEADFEKLCLSKFYEQAEEDLEQFRDENGHWYFVLVHLRCRKKCLNEEISHDKDMLTLELRDLRYLEQMERGYNIALTKITSAKSRLQLEVARGRYIKEIERFITRV